MVEFLDHVFSQVSPTVGYLVLFVSAFVENTFPPIPGDTVTVLGAYLITTGFLGFWGVYASTTTGSVAGFFTMYLIGRKFGRSFLHSEKRARFFDGHRIQKVEAWFNRYGYRVIAANRFLSGTRSVISLFAGIFNLKPLPVLALSFLSALIWNGALIYAGYQLGMNWDRITYIISQYNKVIIVLTILVAAFFVWRKHRKRQNEPE